MKSKKEDITGQKKYFHISHKIYCCFPPSRAYAAPKFLDAVATDIARVFHDTLFFLKKNSFPPQLIFSLLFLNKDAEVVLVSCIFYFEDTQV